MSTTPKPPPPPPILVPEVRWRLSPYLANRRPGWGTLTLEDVRTLVPGGWSPPSARLRRAGYDYSDRHPNLRRDTMIWARQADPDELRLGEAVLHAMRGARGIGVGVAKSTSWHLPHDPTGSGVLRRWRPARAGDKPEDLRTILGAPWAPGEELVLTVGTSPEVVSRRVRAWVRGWAP